MGSTALEALFSRCCRPAGMEPLHVRYQENILKYKKFSILFYAGTNLGVLQNKQKQSNRICAL